MKEIKRQRTGKKAPGKSFRSGLSLVKMHWERERVARSLYKHNPGNYIDHAYADHYYDDLVEWVVDETADSLKDAAWKQKWLRN